MQYIPYLKYLQGAVYGTPLRLIMRPEWHQLTLQLPPRKKNGGKLTRSKSQGKPAEWKLLFYFSEGKFLFSCEILHLTANGGVSLQIVVFNSE